MLMMYNCAASIELWTVNGAVNKAKRDTIAQSSKGSGEIGTNLSLPKESAKIPSNRILTTMGFLSFISAAPIAIAKSLYRLLWTKDRPLRPLNASLSNLVKVSSNPFGLSGKIANCESELTRHCALGLLATHKADGAGSKSLCWSLAPLRNLLSNEKR